MEVDDPGKAPRPGQFVGEGIRALFVLVALGIAVLYVFLTRWSFVTASNAPPPPPNLEPRLGMDEVLTYAAAALCACAGAAGAVRLWLRGSWHVISVAIGTALLVFGFQLSIGLRNWQY